MTRALIIGCSQRVWEDVDAAHKLVAKYDAYYICKIAGIHWKGGRFSWITLHPEFMKVDKLVKTGEIGYVQQRAALGLHSDYEIVSPLATEVGAHGHHEVDRRLEYMFPGQSSSGSTGLFAIRVAIEDGHDRNVLAGVPMVIEDGHFTRDKPWEFAEGFLCGWNQALPYYKDKTRSLSGGWTETLLGRPDHDWLFS